MLEIIPAILEQDWIEIEKRIEIVLPFVKTIHIDVADGIMVPNTTFLDPAPFKKYSDKVFLEAHFMVDDPIKYLKPFVDAGFKRFIGHVEKMPDQEEFVAQGQMLGEVGLAIDGMTSLDNLKVPLEDLDNILIMTIKAGFSGQSFNFEYLEKVRKIKDGILRFAQNDKIRIEVDGGINNQTILQAKEAGATRFAAASAIYKGENPGEQYQILNKLIHS